MTFIEKTVFYPRNYSHQGIMLATEDIDSLIFISTAWQDNDKFGHGVYMSPNDARGLAMALIQHAEAMERRT
jgi:hypothetical protein